MATYVTEGRTVDYTPGSDVAAGDVIVQGTLLGVAKSPIAANVLGALAVDGIFEFAKGTGSASALAAGAKVYWDANSEIVTATSQGNTYAGKVVTAVAASVALVNVRLEQ